MKTSPAILLIPLFLLTTATSAWAHFGMIIPTEAQVTAANRSVELNLSFSHPFEEIGMNLQKPAQFYVMKDGEKTDLRNSLQETQIMKHLGWQTDFAVTRPGVYHFVMEPVPYWEPAEDLSIIHYTKVIVPAFGADEDWDQALGLPTEIVPLLRPFGNYSGNTFVGQVFLDDKPVAAAEVEVEFYNQGQQLQVVSDAHITQVIKTDSAGIFSFSCPQAGWWGFAALNSADYKLKNPQGEDKGVELGAVLWIYMDSYR